MVQSCACGCKPKLENGGEIPKFSQGTGSVMYLNNQGLPGVSTSNYTRLNLTPRNDDYYLSGPYYAGSGLKTTTQPTQTQTQKTTTTQSQPKVQTTQATQPKVQSEASTQPTKVTTQPNTNISVVDYLNSMEELLIKPQELH